MNAIQVEVQCAIRALGYKSGTVKLSTAAHNQLAVIINKDQLGIYDTERHTFVD